MSSIENSESFEQGVEFEAKLNAAQSGSISAAGGLAGGLEGGLGGSPISQMKQDQLVVIDYLKSHLKDMDGCLLKTLISKVNHSEVLFSNHLGEPYIALKLLLQGFLDIPSEVEELTRQVDMLYGQEYGERPYFQRSGQAAHPKDPYTHQSVKESLESLCTSL